MDMTSTKFEEIMSKHNMHEKDEFKSIKSLNIFYQEWIYNTWILWQGKRFRLSRLLTLNLFIGQLF